MIVSFQYEFLYFDVPKTGSWSFDEYFCNNFNGHFVKPENEHRLKHCRIPPANTEKYTRIVSVRNPYERICSMYFYYRTQLIENEEWFSMIDKKIKIRNFDHFLDHVIEVSENTPHYTVDDTKFVFFPITKYMRDNPNHYAIRLENIHEDMSDLPFYDPSIPIKHINKTHYKFDRRPSWNEMYNEERRRKVIRWAEKDFETYGYQA